MINMNTNHQNAPEPTPTAPVNPNNNSPKSDSSPKPNHTIWWILGGSCAAFLIALAVIIYLVAGWLIPQRQEKTTEPKPVEIEDLNENNKKERDDDIKKLEEEIKKLEDQLKNQANDKKDNDDNSPNPAPQPQTGIIEGSLSYPSEQIPDLTVCAEEVGNLPNTVCTSNLIDDPAYTAGRGYQLEVTPGDYYVYSYFIDKTYVAYYTEFVPCGLDISCPSHDYIPVTVNAGDHIYNIDPVDWYIP